MNYEELIRAAIAEAAQSGDDVPVGALIVSADGEVLALGHNEREADSDPTAHITHGSSVTTSVQSSSRQSLRSFAARRIATISACAVGSLSASRSL